jgi:hypothetical protein
MQGICNSVAFEGLHENTKTYYMKSKITSKI